MNTFTREVVVYDQGLCMPRGTYFVPQGWKLYQDIATDPSTGKYVKYKLDFEGPRGEFIRGLAVKNYAAHTGQSFEQQWRQDAKYGLRGLLDQFYIGNLKNSSNLRTYRANRKLEGLVRPQGNQVVCLEAPISGIRNGQVFSGMVQVHNIVSPNMPNTGVFMAVLVISPTHIFPKTMEIRKKISDNFQMNPVWTQRIP